MKIRSAVFDVSAPDLKSCPHSALPEFVFIGRSNVGKSSLINMLTEKKDLAKVSVTPGKTKLINFFTINDTWSLVDLPGYGYAAVGKNRRAEFNEAVADYIEHRKNIFCVFVLIDSRLEPQAIDLEFITWLAGCTVPFALVFTKTDKQTMNHTRVNIAAFMKCFAGWTEEPPHHFATASTTKDGRMDVLKFIEKTLKSSNRG